MAARRRTSGEDRKVGDAGPPTARTQKFLQSWSDPLAGTRAYSANLALADLDGSGNDKLLAATDGKRLRVYSGSDMASEHFLLEEPVAMVAYHSDTRTPPIPSVAVAGGSYVFICESALWLDDTCSTLLRVCYSSPADSLLPLSRRSQHAAVLQIHAAGGYRR